MKQVGPRVHRCRRCKKPVPAGERFCDPTCRLVFFHKDEFTDTDWNVVMEACQPLCEDDGE